MWRRVKGAIEERHEQQTNLGVVASGRGWGGCFYGAKWSPGNKASHVTGLDRLHGRSLE